MEDPMPDNLNPKPLSIEDALRAYRSHLTDGGTMTTARIREELERMSTEIVAAREEGQRLLESLQTHINERRSAGTNEGE